MDRRRGITVTAILMSVTNALGWTLIDWNATHAVVRFFSFTAIIFVGYLMIWFYWKGENWARILVIWCSALAVLNLSDWNNIHAGKIVIARHLMLASEAGLGVFLLYWLNTTTVRAFFRRNTA